MGRWTIWDSGVELGLVRGCNFAGIEAGVWVRARAGAVARVGAEMKLGLEPRLG